MYFKLNPKVNVTKIVALLCSITLLSVLAASCGNHSPNTTSQDGSNKTTALKNNSLQYSQTAAAINLPSGYTLNQFTQMSFNNSVPTSGVTSDHNFFPTMSAAAIPNISSYIRTSAGKVILSDTATYPNISIYDPTGVSPITSLNTITGDKILHAFAVGKSLIYGCSENGNIYSIDPSVVTTGSYKPLTQIPTPYNVIMQCITDTSSPTGDVIYTLSMDGSGKDPYGEYLCSTTASSGATACYKTAASQLNPSLMAANGVVYVESTDVNRNMTINAFTISSGNLIQYPGFNTVSIPFGSTASPLVYGSDTAGNKFIYVVIQQGKTFQLQEINATTGAPLWSFPFGLNVTISNPFVTKNGNVIVVSSDSKYVINNNIYGLTTTGEPAFASGYTLPLPQVSTPALSLMTSDSSLSNTIDIPAILAADGKTIVVYSMNTNW